MSRKTELTQTIKFAECVNCSNFCTMTCLNCDTGEFYETGKTYTPSADTEMSKGFRSEEIWGFISEQGYD